MQRGIGSLRILGLCQVYKTDYTSNEDQGCRRQLLLEGGRDGYEVAHGTQVHVEKHRFAVVIGQANLQG